MMDRPGESDNEMALTKGIWSSQFDIRKHPQIYEQENKSYVQDVYGQPSPEDNVGHMFMQEPSKPIPNLHRNDLLGQFFKNVDLRHFQSDIHDVCSRSDSLLDDREPSGFGNIYEDGGLCRIQKGPLSPRQLFFELSKPRYTVATLAAGTRKVGKTKDAEPNAERRIIYTTDPNPWSILAIIATASTNQAAALRDFIYAYLDYQALFSVSISTGATRFSLEVHLPYYAWRQGSRPNKDLRTDGSGQPLRRVRCLPFLQGEQHSDDHSSCTEHIYQAQLSFLVSGTDNLSWVGYCFVDTYHDGDESEDSVQNYPSPETSPDKIRMDPASGGNFPATPPFWSPRVYFLQVIQYRMGMINGEWANVVSMIQFRLESYTRGLPLSRQLQQCREASDRLEQLSIFYDRLHDTIRLLLDLKHTISKTINALDAVFESELGCFTHGHATTKDAERAASAILVIKRHSKQIRLLSEALHNQEKLCNNIARELEQHMTVENNRTTWIQLQTGENVKSITLIAVLVSPPSIAAAIFSMSPEVLPFERNLGSYAVTVIVVAVPIVILLWFLRRESQRKTRKKLRSVREPGLIQPERFQDHGDEERQIIRSSSMYESIEGGIKLHNVSPTRSRARLNNPSAFELSTSYQLCQVDFKSLLRIATHGNMRGSRVVEIMLENYGRFRLWGEQVQVLSPRAQESLWNTLQNQPAMKETVRSTFQLISRCLKKALERLEASLATMDHESLSNWADDSDVNSSSDSEDSNIPSSCGKTPSEEPVHTLLYRLYDQIDFLFRVSSHLRHQGSHSRHQSSNTRSDPSIDLEVDQSLVRSIVEYWRKARLENDKAQTVRMTESNMMIASSLDDILVSRVAAAIAQRRITLAQVASQPLPFKSETHERDESSSIESREGVTLDTLQLYDSIPPFNVIEPAQTGHGNKNRRFEFDHSEPSNFPGLLPISTPEFTTSCNNCKWRRIKCDEKRPACTGCIRSGKECKGYPPAPNTRFSEEVEIVPRPVTSNVTVIASTPGAASSTFSPQRRITASAIKMKPKVSSQRQHNDSSFITIGSTKLRVPLVPLITEEYFDCPLCHDRLESYKITDRTMWKHHVYGDLRPYLCTYQDCSSPDRTYATRYDWIYHERQMHQIQWRCRECYEIFHSKATLASHLEQSHVGLWNAAQIAILSDMSEEPQEDESQHTCPFCLQRLTLAKVSNHVAEHLEELSLYSLPEVHQHWVPEDYQSDQD